MKKIITLVLLCLLFLTSCSANITSGSSPDTSGADTGKDSYLYLAVDGVLYKYNIQTGYATPVCQDPLCHHDSDKCPFYGIVDAVMPVGNKLYFVKGSQICVYDTSDGDLKTLYDTNGAVFYPFMADKYIYYNTLTTKKENGELVNNIDLFRFNIEDNSCIQLNKELLYGFNFCSTIINDKIYWDDIGTNMSYSTNFSYGNKVEGADLKYSIQSKNYEYRLEVVNRQPIKVKLIVKKKSGSDEYMIADNVASFKVMDDCILLLYNTDTPKQVGTALDENESETAIYDYQCNDIYIADCDGGNKKLLCSISDNYVIFNMTNSDGALIRYPYIGIMLWEYEYDEKGYIAGKEIAKDIIILNIKTGEYKITISE